MKQNWLILLFSVAFTGFISAQNTTIVQELNSVKAGQGEIIIHQDESIEGLIGTRSNKASSTTTTNATKTNTSPNVGEGSSTGLKPTSYIQTKGYKIQVFSGNNQKRSKDEAYSRKGMIERSFPDKEVTVTFNSPVWRVRAGNYRTYEEAFEALKDMQKMFPSFGREMEIKEAVVKLPVY